MKLRVLALATALLAAIGPSVFSSAEAAALRRHGGWHRGWTAGWHPVGWGWDSPGLGLVPGAIFAPSDAAYAAYYYGTYGPLVTSGYQYPNYRYGFGPGYVLGSRYGFSLYH